MNKSSLIVLLAVAINIVLLVLAGNVEVQHEPGQILFGDIFSSVKGYLLAVGVVSYLFWWLSDIERKKELSANIDTVLDSIIHIFYRFFGMIGIIIGAMGIAGYLQ